MLRHGERHARGVPLQSDRVAIGGCGCLEPIVELENPLQPPPGNVGPNRFARATPTERFVVPLYTTVIQSTWSASEAVA